jgi:hypothetical protein
MTQGRCRRLWEVEAARDGRLQGDTFDDARRHQAHCADCTRQVERLERLGRALRAAGPAPLDTMSQRRMRHVMLERADASLTARRPRVSARLAWVTALGLLLVGAAGAWRVWSGHTPTARPYAVMPDPKAAWSERIEGRLWRLRLEAGTIRLAVHHRPGEPRLVVDVPDGQIEDQGTRFSVTVELNQTTRIDVEQGTVVFRHRDGTVVWVTGASPWRRNSTQSAPMPSFAQTTPEQRPPEVAPSTAVRQADELRQTRARSRVLRPRDTSPAPSGASVPDPRSEEDSVYLHVLALMGEGQRDEARAAAQAYLRRFPAGFRRVEVEQIAR